MTQVLNENGEQVVNFPNWKALTLTPKHREIWECSDSKIILNCGRGFGKDHILFQYGYKVAFEWFAKRSIDPDWSRPGPLVHMVIILPTEDQHKTHWRRTKSYIPDIPGVAKNGKSQINYKGSEYIIEIFGENGILISFLSGNAQLRGDFADICLVSEAAYINESHLRDKIFPLIIRPGVDEFKIMLNSTPTGPGSWWDSAVQECREKQQGKYWSSWTLFEGNYTDNPRTTSDQIAEYMLEKSKNLYRFRRERLGWINIECYDDAIFDSNSDNLAIKDQLIQQVFLNQPVNFRPPFRIGVDVAFTGSDSCAIAVIDANGVIAHLENYPKISDVNELISLLTKLFQQYNPISINYDANGVGAELNGKVNHLRARPVVTKNKGKHDFVSHFLQLLAAGAVRIPNPDYWQGNLTKEVWLNFHRLLREMRYYQRHVCEIDRVKNQRKEKGSYITYSKPPNGSDDMLDAVILASLDIKIPTKAMPLPDFSSSQDIGENQLIEIDTTQYSAERRRRTQAIVNSGW